MYEITITETGRNNLKEKAHIFNEETKRIKSKEDIKEFLKERYGKIPTIKERNKMYIDSDGSPIEVGFVYGFWNQDISHNSKRWFQTDWITIKGLRISYPNLKDILN